MPRANPAAPVPSPTPPAPRADAPAPRPLRADAKRNYELLVTAADAVFTEHGADAAFEDIAKRAGVGIGTLYRHFPTRDALLAAVLDDATAAIVARAGELLDAPSPTLGLARWLEALVGFVAMYKGLTEVVAAAYTDKGDPLCPGCEAILGAGTALLRRAQDAGEIRADVDAGDVVMAAHAAAWVGERLRDPEAPARLLATQLAGLREHGGKPTARAKKPGRG